MTTRLLLILVAFGVLSVAVARCGKKLDEDTAQAINLVPHTTYEMTCLKQPWRPEVVWPTPTPEPPVANNISRVKSRIEVQSCDGLDGEPQFFQNEMPGLTSVVDCNDRLIRFRIRDYATGEMTWILNERTMISPSGEFDARLMYVTRLFQDATGTPNCWTRVLGHIKGKVDCTSEPSQARMSFNATWTFDETPPEVMEPPQPGTADARNGPHCKIAPGNCLFSNNNVALGCNGN